MILGGMIDYKCVFPFLVFQHLIIHGFYYMLMVIVKI